MKPMLMPAPTEAARPTRKVCQLLCVAKAAANSGASVDTEPSIRPARPGWTYCRTKSRRARALLGRLGVGGEVGLGDLLGALLVPALDLGELGEELARRDVGRLACRLVVEIRGLALHELGLGAHLVEIEVRAPPRPAGASGSRARPRAGSAAGARRSGSGRGRRGSCGGRAPPRPCRRRCRPSLRNRAAADPRSSGRFANPLPRWRSRGRGSRAPSGPRALSRRASCLDRF